MLKKDVNDIKIPLRMKIKDSLGTEKNIIKQKRTG